MKRILIVDDDKDTRDVMKKKIEQNNYAAFTASDGKEALLICDIYRPHLILLDIAMPKMDGYALAVNLRKSKCFKDTPILFLTGKELTTESVMSRMSEIGACDFLAKPCSFDKMLEKIQNLLTA